MFYSERLLTWSCRAWACVRPARFSRPTLGRPKRAGFPCMASFPKIRVPREKSAGSGDFLYGPIGCQHKSDLCAACNSLERKRFIAGRMRADNTRLHRIRPPLLAKEGPAICLVNRSVPPRLRASAYLPIRLRCLACPRRCWYFGRPFRRSANRIQPPASRSPSPAQGSMT
jgi:hypothetical protein